MSERNPYTPEESKEITTVFARMRTPGNYINTETGEDFVLGASTVEMTSEEIKQNYVTERVREALKTSDRKITGVLRDAKCIEGNSPNGRIFHRVGFNEKLCDECPFKNGCIILEKQKSTITF